MARLALDRAARSVERFGLASPAERWRGMRDEIRAEVLRLERRGGSFVRYYGARHPDAAPAHAAPRRLPPR